MHLSFVLHAPTDRWWSGNWSDVPSNASISRSLFICCICFFVGFIAATFPTPCPGGCCSWSVPRWCAYSANFFAFEPKWKRYRFCKPKTTFEILLSNLIDWRQFAIKPNQFLHLSFAISIWLAVIQMLFYYFGVL